MKRNLKACFYKVTEEEGWVGFPLEFLREVCVTFALHRNVQKVVDCKGFQMAVTREATADMDEIPAVYPQQVEIYSYKRGKAVSNVSKIHPKRQGVMKGIGQLINETRSFIYQRA